MVKVIKNFVKVNQYTRPGLKLAAVNGIVMHWTATPGASALNERNYFNGTCIIDKRYASAHYFVDRHEAQHVIPDQEVAYHAHDQNLLCQLPEAECQYHGARGRNVRGKRRYHP
ncbi:N-acetylmuramoyl-L-alanine amidase [Bacillus paralicheniformis]|uniref:N-acetylmuramoyl-L-alanine amidase n=1 Tax=Bacillus paralicheniformis TaxID=1648923 RepID=UPI003BFA7A16